jgi:hypothetical protein
MTALQSPQNSLCHGHGCTRTDLIEAHIIPKGFGRFVRGDAHNLTVTLNGADYSRLQLGQYDNNILCGECDNRLGVFDNYALQFCKSFKQEHKLVRPGVFELADVDGDTFAKFVLAVLWRASISSRPDYANVSLGPYTDVARDVLFGVQPLSGFKEFPVMVQRYTSKHFDTEGFYSLPVPAPFGEFACYGFGIAGFRVMAKVDSRPLPTEWSSFILDSSNTLRGFFVEIERTLEFERIAQMMVADHFRELERSPHHRPEE